MTETVFETLTSAASALNLDFSSQEFAGFAEDHAFSEEAIEAVSAVFAYLKEKADEYGNDIAQDESAAHERAKNL